MAENQVIILFSMFISNLFLGNSKVIGYLPAWNNAYSQPSTYKYVTNLIVAFLTLTKDGQFEHATLYVE